MISSLSLWPAMLGYFAGLWVYHVRRRRHRRRLTSREWIAALLDFLRRRY